MPPPSGLNKHADPTTENTRTSPSMKGVSGAADWCAPPVRRARDRWSRALEKPRLAQTSDHLAVRPRLPRGRARLLPGPRLRECVQHAVSFRTPSHVSLAGESGFQTSRVCEASAPLQQPMDEFSEASPGCTHRQATLCLHCLSQFAFQVRSVQGLTWPLPLRNHDCD